MRSKNTARTLIAPIRCESEKMTGPEKIQSADRMVTVAQYGRFLDAHPSIDKPLYWDQQKHCLDYPTVGVSALEADTYAACVGGSLPTEKWWIDNYEKLPDGYGLYEWTSTADGLGNKRHILRGGSWRSLRDFARAAYRYFIRPASRYSFVGFRVVGVVSPPSN